MKPITSKFLWSLGIALSLWFMTPLSCLGGQPPDPPSQVWHYLLLPGSQLVDECPICARPTITQPLRGAFDLRLIQEDPLFCSYAVENCSFIAGTESAPLYKVVGQGFLQIGGEVARLQSMFLAASIDDGRTNWLCYLTNTTTAVNRLWPAIDITLTQTNGTLTREYTLRLNAAPLREIWFSTRHNFHAGIWPAASNYVSAGDLISSTGRIVKRNADLTAPLGVMPIVPDLGLDAIDVMPGGEIAFSMESQIWSETLGTLADGDILSNHGRVVRNYGQLLKPFGLMPPITDPGLDALQALDTGEIYFSIKTNIFSEATGRMLRRGDLLSSAGRIVKTNEQLLALFHPALPKADYGLDALYVWPNGEIWFSIEDGFQDQLLGPILDGDLLSDQGYVVYRNRDLLAPFQPLEDLADFGLDALFLVTDANFPATTVATPLLEPIQFHPALHDVLLQWTSPGRVFQVEKATNILGPWVPLSPILTEPVFIDPAALSTSPQGFYRVRQW